MTSARRWLASAAIALCLAGTSSEPGLYDLEADDLQSGLPVPLSYYRGKVVLIVNVASQCGYTDATYTHLNTLHERYASRGLAILAFPCNQFGGQEPGTADDIFDFVSRKKRAAFDFFRKVEVNGPSAHPLFKLLLGQGGKCADDDGNCAEWAAQGECDANTDFMHTACRRSCKLCTAPASAGQPIRWNFEIFLLSRSGELQKRWATGTDLTALPQTSAIEALLAAPKSEL